MYLLNTVFQTSMEKVILSSIIQSANFFLWDFMEVTTANFYHHFLILYFPMIIGKCDLQKRIIGTKVSTIIIENTKSAKEAVLK